MLEGALPLRRLLPQQKSPGLVCTNPYLPRSINTSPLVPHHYSFHLPPITPCYVISRPYTRRACEAGSCSVGAALDLQPGQIRSIVRPPPHPRSMHQSFPSPQTGTRRVCADVCLGCREVLRGTMLSFPGPDPSRSNYRLPLSCLCCPLDPDATFSMSSAMMLRLPPPPHLCCGGPRGNPGLLQIRKSSRGAHYEKPPPPRGTHPPPSCAAPPSPFVGQCP